MGIIYLFVIVSVAFASIEDLTDQIEKIARINEENSQRIANLEAEILKTKRVGDPDLDERVGHLENLARSKLFRSCHEMYQQGINKTGFYEIDPDGESKGELPIEVYCNFEYGLTEVLHHLDNVTWTVPHCEDEFCAQWNITYPAPMNQLQALIEIHKLFFCEW